MHLFEQNHRILHLASTSVRTFQEIVVTHDCAALSFIPSCGREQPLSNTHLMVYSLPTPLDVNNSADQSLSRLINSYDCPVLVLQFTNCPIGLAAWNDEHWSGILIAIVVLEESSDVREASIV